MPKLTDHDIDQMEACANEAIEFLKALAEKYKNVISLGLDEATPEQVARIACIERKIDAVFAQYS